MYVNGQPKGKAQREERARFVEENFLASAEKIEEAKANLARMKKCAQPKTFTTKGKSTVEVLAFLYNFRL